VCGTGGMRYLDHAPFDAYGIGGEGSDAGGSAEADSGRTGLKVPNELELLGGARPTGSGGAPGGISSSRCSGRIRVVGRGCGPSRAAWP
jgi:hypothetical protein